MKFLSIVFFAIFASVALGSPLTQSSNEEFLVPQSRNVFQTFLINQIVNVLPVNIREKINGAAASFGMTRNQFLLRVLKELQAFQDYSKIDFITAIQKTVKFIDGKLTDEQKQTLETLEEQGIELANLLIANQLSTGQLNKFYDLIVKVVRQQIDSQTFVDQLTNLVTEIVPGNF